jgi:hypothetical protein
LKQSRAASLVESITNIAVGLSLSIGLQAIVLPALGVPIPWSVNFAFAGLMTVVSIARSFALRRLFEALHFRHPLSPGALAIIAERRRQIEGEGWTAEHDDKQHETGELAMAGAAYVFGAVNAFGAFPGDKPPVFWPWSREWWKPQDYRRDLVRAGALILAEIDRHDRNRKPQALKGTVRLPSGDRITARWPSRGAA